MLYFWKAKGPRTSKMIFWTVRYTNTQIQIHKYTNTQIQHMTKWPKYPTYAIFLNSWWFKDVKNDNTKYSDPRYTVDFCTVPPGLFPFKPAEQTGQLEKCHLDSIAVALYSYSQIVNMSAKSIENPPVCKYFFHWKPTCVFTQVENSDIAAHFNEFNQKM